MSRAGNGWGHAPMERFMATLQTEWVHHRQDATRAETRRDLFDYIESFDNRQRLHSALGYVSPAQVESQFSRQ
ncbi:MAG: transposase [Armatimonadetes bacterium]|nr:transposase [Armatimonadota bacterium]